MPMIDAYATVGTFADKQRLAQDLAAAVMKIEQVPDIPMFRKNTAAFVHELPAGALSNVDGDGNYVRVQVLTNAGALDRDKQLAVVSRLTEIIAAAAGDPSLADRTWVLLTEAPEGGWGLWGHAHTNAELVGAARAQLAELAEGASPRLSQGASASARASDELGGFDQSYGHAYCTAARAGPPARVRARDVGEHVRVWSGGHLSGAVLHPGGAPGQPPGGARPHDLWPDRADRRSASRRTGRPARSRSVVRVTLLVQFLSALSYLFIRDFAAFVVVSTVDMLAMNANQAADGALLRRVGGEDAAVFRSANHAITNVGISLGAVGCPDRSLHRPLGRADPPRVPGRVRAGARAGRRRKGPRQSSSPPYCG